MGGRGAHGGPRSGLAQAPGPVSASGILLLHSFYTLDLFSSPVSLFLRPALIPLCLAPSPEC